MRIERTLQSDPFGLIFAKLEIKCMQRLERAEDWQSSFRLVHSWVSKVPCPASLVPIVDRNSPELSVSSTS